MTGALIQAILLVALCGWALLLAGLAAADVAARMRLRARAIAVTLPDRPGLDVRNRADDALLGARQNSFMDRLAQRLIPNAAGLIKASAASGVRLRPSHLLLGAVGAALLLLLGFAALGLDRVFALLLVVAALALSPRLLMWSLKRSQRQRFQSQLPEALGLMVRALRAGVPVGEAVAEVGRELKDPVGGAFRHAYDSVRLGQPLEAALVAETGALDLPAMNFLIVTLSVQRETGGNLAETIEKLDDILRRRAQMQLKVKAMSAEAKASAGIIGALPILMAALMAMVSPDYMMPLFTTSAGQVILGAALLSLGFGALVMAQLVSIDV
jgi:tight adherence protein B